MRPVQFRGVALAALLCLIPAYAQETRATLSGTIIDPSGAAIVGVKLSLVNVDTSATSQVETNQLGQYRILFLNPGKYRLTAEMSGFKTLVREGIELSTNQAATVDLSLQLGTQTDTVTVGSEAPLLEAEKADRGGVVLTRNLAELPIITRTPILLATMVPGVTATNPRYDLTPFSNAGLTTWSINGSTSLSTEFLLDGAPNSAVYESNPSVAYIPPVDAVQELKVTTGAYDAQYGHNGGGVINMTIKSGTNQMHGSVYDFLKRPSLNANSFANNSKGVGRDNNSLNEYGFSFGAPVWIPKVYNGKDRTFFFLAWEHYGQNILFPQNDISSVPTVAQRTGDFSQTLSAQGQLMPIYDPDTGRTVSGNWVRDLFPGNRIPVNRFDPVGVKIANLYPEPNTTTQGSVPWQNNFFLNDNVTWYDFNNFATRVDHSVSEKHRIYGRYVWNNQLLHQNSNGLPGYAADLREGTKINNGFSFDSLSIINPSTMFDLRASITRWVQDYKPTNWGSYDAAVIGWPKELVGRLPEPNRFPTFSVNSYKTVGPSANNIWLAPTTTIALAPTLTMNRGRHGIKFGLDYRWIRYANYQSIGTGGTFAFDRAFTRSNYLTQDALSGSAVASLLLGAPATGEVINLVKPYYSWKYYAPWIQDDIKVSRRLTINLGLRLDLTMPVTEKYNRINRGFFATTLNPITSQIDQSRFPGYKAFGGIGFAGQNGEPRSPFDTDTNNWQPRVGAAFQLTSTTVVRGGWGLSYIPSVSTGSSLGFTQSTPFVSSVDAGRTIATLISNPFPSGILRPSGSALGLSTQLGQGPTFSDPSGSLGYVHSFSFGIQKQLRGNVKIDASYVGSRTMGMPTSRGFNELNTEQLALGDVRKGGNPNYLNERLPNPFENLLPGSSLNTSTVTRQQLLRPFPQFTSFNRQAITNGKVWYNALQVAASKRYSHGLMVTAAYTLSKNIQALNYLNAQDSEPGRSLVPWDRTHRLVLAPIYDFPFGPGKRFLGGTRGVVGLLAGGWQIAMNSTFQVGNPMTVPGNVFLLRNPAIPNPTWDRMFNTSFIEADGVTIRNQQPGEQPAFQIQPPFTQRTASQYYGNLRNLWDREYNVTLAKNTLIREGWTVQFRAEAFNLFNHPIFGNDPNLDVTSTNFGRIIRTNGQLNFPRQVQLGIRLSF